MSELESFTSTLNATLSASRLSGSKVQSLTSLSEQLVIKAQDTSLVTSFLRANNALPPAGQGRISSLYVFDAMARNARTGANKEKEKGKAREGRGMTGLITKMEGVVESWVNGMMDDGKGGIWAEGREKTKKVLDIWTKNSTFPLPTLDRLKSKLAGFAPPSAPSSVKSPSFKPDAQSTTPKADPAATLQSILSSLGDGYAGMGSTGDTAQTVTHLGNGPDSEKVKEATLASIPIHSPLSPTL